jgi:hypothetical protein
LRGADLRGADLGGVYLRGADLGGADLRDADLGGADLRDADLGGADLGDADQRGADLGGADLRGADLGGADLRGADLGGVLMPAGFDRAAHEDPETPYVRKAPAAPDRPILTPEERKARRIATRAESAARYREQHPDVPVVERLDRRILEAVAAPGCALDMGTWHSCETTHCRAGWAVHLAGKAGYALEEKLGGPEQAGRAIYRASTGRVPYFFATNERAFEDLRRCAEEDAAAR